MTPESRTLADFPEAWIAEIHQRPLCQFLQIQMRHYKQGAASARMRLSPQSLEPDGLVSEGALATLGSWTAQLAIFTLVGQGRSIVPLEHRISLLHTARAGDLIAKARVEHLRARLAHCSYRIVDQDGEVVAVGGFLADVLPREPMLRTTDRSLPETSPPSDDPRWAEEGDASSLDVASPPPPHEHSFPHQHPSPFPPDGPLQTVRSQASHKHSFQDEPSFQQEHSTQELHTPPNDSFQHNEAVVSIDVTDDSASTPLFGLADLPAPASSPTLPKDTLVSQSSPFDDDDSLEETVLSSVGSLLQGRPLPSSSLNTSTPPTRPTSATASLPPASSVSATASLPPASSVSATASLPPASSASATTSLPPVPSASSAASISTHSPSTVSSTVVRPSHASPLPPPTNVGRITSEWSSPFVPKASASPTSSIGNPTPIVRTGAYSAIPDPLMRKDSSSSQNIPTPPHPTAEDTEKYTRPSFSTEDTEKHTRPLFLTENTEKHTRPPLPTEDSETYTPSLSTHHGARTFDEHLDTGEFDSPTDTHTMLSWRAAPTPPNKEEPPSPSVIDADFFDDEPKTPSRR
ncbi:hotdog fold thioesterase [Myxococcota bacterium]|nr:hotdog fold thioesterase [Myxococcota bacterium]